MARMATVARTPLCDEQEMVWSHCGTTALDGMDKAFKNPSSIQSVDALELFLSQKCFAGGLGLSTAQRIQGCINLLTWRFGYDYVTVM